MHHDDLKLGPGCLSFNVAIIFHIGDVGNSMSAAAALRSRFIKYNLPQASWTEQERGGWLTVREGCGSSLT